MRKQLVESVAEINELMQENDNESIFGKADNLLRQQEFFSNITAFNESEVKSVSLAENRSVVKWFLHYKRKQWGMRKFHQVGVQQWQSREKFYYGSSVYSPK